MSKGDPPQFLVLYWKAGEWRLFWAGKHRNLMDTRYLEASRIHDKAIAGSLTSLKELDNEE